MSKKKQSCPVCGKEKKNLDEHLRICHPDYKLPEVQETHVEISTAPENPTPEQITPMVETPIPPVPPKDTPKETVAIEKERTTRNYVKIVLSIPLFLGGLLILWVGRNNPITILFGAALMSGGFFLAKSGWQQGNVRIISGPADKQTGKFGIPPNTLVLHCVDTNHVTNWFSYEYVDHPIGQRKKRRNDGKWFYVMREKSKEDRTLIEHTLPDNSEAEVYCDPTVMANALSLPATKRMFDFSPDNLKTISLLIMLGIVIAEIIALIALSGDSGQKAASIINLLNGVMNV